MPLHPLQIVNIIYTRVDHWPEYSHPHCICCCDSRTGFKKHLHAKYSYPSQKLVLIDHYLFLLVTIPLFHLLNILKMKKIQVIVFALGLHLLFQAAPSMNLGQKNKLNCELITPLLNQNFQ